MIVGLYASVVFLGLATPAPGPSATAETRHICGAPAENVEWLTRLRSAGFVARSNGSFSRDGEQANLLLITCDSGRPRASFSITVGPSGTSSQQQLDRQTPELVRQAVESLESPEAALLLEYVTLGTGATPASVRGAS